MYYIKGSFAPQGLGGRKMTGISRYEKAVLGLAAAFLIFTGGWFLGGRNTARPYVVTTAQSVREEAALAQPEQAREDERPDSLMEGETIDVNTADVYELQRLPGIGEKRAQAIVDYREEHGPFQSVEDLDGVKGIGEGILSGLEGYVTVDGAEK